MGGTTETVAVEVTPANPPRERKFQVVPVPGVFTRGRWRCVDFHDENPPAELSESMVRFSDAEKQAMEAAEMIQNGVAIEEVNAKPNVTVAEKESSTIVVTSIRPAPATPQHGAQDCDSTPTHSPYTPQLASIPHGSISNIVPMNPNTPDTPTNLSPEHLSTPQMHPIPPNCLSGSSSVPILSTQHSHTIPSPCTLSTPSSGVPIPIPNPTFEILSQVDVPASSSCSTEDYLLKSQQTSSLSQQTIQSQQGVHSMPTTMTSNTEFVPSVLPQSSSAVAVDTPMEEDQSGTAISVVAIDNKIEQAMDLVKTHLTFAVREEVEVLRNTIAELESKVTHLESQNAFMKQFVPSDVLSNLPLLIQQHKAAQAALAPPPQQHSSTASSTSVGVALQPLQTNVQVPPEFKNVNFESTLNNVVADIRNAVSRGNYSSLSSLGTAQYTRPQQPQ